MDSIIRGRSAVTDAEAERLTALRQYDILDTPPDGAFDRITALAADLFSVPISIVSLVDHDRIWFKSHHGLRVEQIGRDLGLCASAILQDEPWVVADARADIRALANPLVAGEFGLRFYVGIPLRTQDGFNLGTLCVIDREPRPVIEKQIAHLKHLATVVMDQMEVRLSARLAVRSLSVASAEKDAALRRAAMMAKEADHRVMNSLQITSSLLRLHSQSLDGTEAAQQLAFAATRISAVARVHQHLYVGDDDGTMDCGTYLRRLCTDLSSTLRPDHTAIEVNVVSASFPSAKMVPLGLIVAELVVNAIKYGGGNIRVSLEQAADGEYALSVSDEGAGLPNDYNLDAATGLGMRLIATLVDQLHGRLDHGANSRRGGAKFTVYF
ncbi:sensor histidine kinase [Falsiroseomonas sp. E2-1-a20]|uniref:sensor histidine kinase n=1 Tax=Falsiroseomonas sp. E2-1-a20 TaxID=3239300 RepID=UPI003F2DDE81